MFTDVCVALGEAPHKRELIARLCAAGLAVIDAAREGRLRFVHDLLTEAIAEALPDPTPVHRAAAEIWSRKGRKWQDRAAVHWAALGARAHQIEALCEASAEMRNVDLSAAEALARRALAAARGGPHEPRAAVALGEVFEARQATDDLHHLVEEAIDRVDPDREPSVAVRLWALRARVAWMRDDIERLDRYAHRIAALLPRVDPTLRCRLLLRLSTLLALSHPEEAITLCEAACDCAPTMALAAESRMLRANHLINVDRCREALLELDFIRPMMVDQGSLLHRSGWYAIYGRTLVHERPQEAPAYLLEAIRCRRRLGGDVSWLACDAVACAVREGRPELAAEILEASGPLRDPLNRELVALALLVLEGRLAEATAHLAALVSKFGEINGGRFSVVEALSGCPDPLGAAARALLPAGYTAATRPQ